MLTFRCMPMSTLRTIVVIVAMLATWLPAVLAQVPPITPIFREVRITSERIIALGKLIPTSELLCSWAANTCHLKHGTFGGAQAIAISVNRQSNVHSIRFEYGIVTPERRKNQIDSYSRLFGRLPICVIAPTRAEACIWRDERTEFELLYESSEGPIRASATLRDRVPSAIQE